MKLLQQLASDLERRRRALGMSCAALAARAGLGLRTVQRTLSQEGTTPQLETLEAIAHALDVSLRIVIDCSDVEDFKQRQAESKASRLVAVTQGSSALEAQAIPEPELKRLRNQTTARLLAGSTRSLWAE